VRLLLVLVATAATAAVAADTASVQLVFNGHGASTYNKWLYENAKKYQDLAPIYVQIDSGVGIDTGPYSFYVSFLDDRGGVARRRTFVGRRELPPGGGIGAQVTPDGAALLVSPWYDRTTVYDRHGDSAFTSTGGYLSGNGGLFFHAFRDDEGGFYRDYIEILDARGRLLDTIGRLAEPSVHAHVWSRDRVHALYVSDTAGRVLVMDRRGKTLWQTRFSYQTDADIAISEDGRFAAAATWDSLTVRDMRARRTFTRSLHEGSHGKFIGPRVAISPDNRYVAVTRVDRDANDSCTLDVFTLADAAICTSMVLRTGFVVDVGFVGEGLGLVALPLTRPEAGAPHVPRQRSSWEEPYRIVLVGLDGKTRAWDDIGSPRLRPPFKFTRSAVALYSTDSIWVYRVEPAAPEKKR
jgi:hypothetical protein